MICPPARADTAALPLRNAVVRCYAEIAHAAYRDASETAGRLQQTIASFLAAPSDESLRRARAAWIAARTPYLQTEVYRFVDGPVEHVEPRINAWPIDEHYIDYVEGAPDAGVINRPARHPAITRELIVSLNEKEGEKNISTGYHAIEFLLWGQDFNDRGPGERSHRDYLPAGGARNVERRREYLRIVTALLVEDLKQVASEWAPGRADNYRARLLAMPANEALGIMLKGLGSLSGPELAGERLTVPCETKEQEDEHSCFSDTTLNDVFHDLAGVQNLWLGRYTNANGQVTAGPGLEALVARVNPPLAKKLGDEIKASLAAAWAIPPPFDQAIQGNDAAPGRVAIKELIKAIETHTDTLAQAAAALSIKLNL